MFTYLEKKDLLKKEQKQYGEAIGKMICRKFYDANPELTIKYDNNDGYVDSHLHIEYHPHVWICVGFYKELGVTCIMSISITILDEYENEEDYISLDITKKDNNYSIRDYHEFIRIQNNIIVSDEQEDIINTFHNTLRKNSNLNFLESICKYAETKYLLMISTHYLTNLNAAYTLLLINKQRSHTNRIPLDVMKIIINKLFFK